MTTKRIKKNYSVTYQVVENIPVDSMQANIDNAFDILFDAILERENSDKESVDTSRQEGVYCEYGISNKKRGCEILQSSSKNN